ncbi:MAG: TetR/AcrR family transcriptional regulator [Chitinophagaceae bacterium]
MQLDKEAAFREEIIKKAQQLFQQYGVRKTTMEDIAKAMGKGKSTLYYYFNNKEQIFDIVIQQEMMDVFNTTQKAVNEQISAEKKLIAFASTKMRETKNKINLYKIVQGDFHDSNRCVKHLSQEFEVLEQELVQSILNFGISNGEFNSLLEKEMDLLPSIITSSLRGIERDIFMGNKYDILESRIEALISFMINGIK